MSARKLGEGSIVKFVALVKKTFKTQIAPHKDFIPRSLQEAFLAQVVVQMAGGWENGDEIAASSVHELYVRCVAEILPATD